MKKNIEIAVSIVLSDVFQKLQAIQQSLVLLQLIHKFI